MPPGTASRGLLAVALATMASGCATNALRVQDAKSVSTATSAAAAGADAFLATVDAARERTTIALAVADPACAQDRPEIRAAPLLDRSAPDVGALCVVQPIEGSARRLDTAPLGPDLEPTLRLVEALALYGDELAAIAAPGSGTSASAPLVDALSLARSAQTILGPPKAGGVPSTEDPRVKAAQALVDFLVGLEREAATVARLRDYIARNPDAVGGIVAPLRRQIGSWERGRAGDAGLRIVAAGWATARIVKADPPASPDDRRRALESFYDVRRAMQAEARFAPVVLQALDAVASADRDLRRVLAPDAGLSKTEKRRVAAIARERLVTGFADVAALASALRG